MLTRFLLVTLAFVAFDPTPIARPLAQSPSGAAPTSSPAERLAHGSDLSGVWTADASRLPERVRGAWVWAFDPEPPPMTAWALERFAQAKPTFGPKNYAVAETNDPVYQCFPPGTPRIYFHPFPMEIIQTPGRVLILYEYDHYVRQIFTDGRGHREDLPASWMGDSIGRWEGDTLVVQSTNFNDKTWIDRRGVPHSDQLKVTERFRRSGEKALHLHLTIEDPVAFTEPWTAERFFELTDWNIIEMTCMDNANFLEFEQDVLQHDPKDKPKPDGAANPY
jgi:hypothetical protein